MIYNIIISIICILIPLFIFKGIDKIEKRNFKNWVKENKFKVIVYIVLVIGFLVRIVNIQNVPNGLNADEASAAYEAYAIGNYGIDRNGNFMPVFLVSWGSGQNALLTYLAIPFVKILGLTALAIRLPMAILGCISLFIMYRLLLELKDKKLALVGLMFFAICPWHIMKSRWGLESNLFPDLTLIAVYIIAYALNKNKISMIYVAFMVLGLCAYAYGTSYFFLPMFVIPLLIYLLKKKKINWKNALISMLIIFIVSFPIILCVFINTFKLQQTKLLMFTIPIMTANRYEELSSLFSKTFIIDSIRNFKESMQILLLQTDGFGWNAIIPFGITYLFSLPLTIIGIVKNFRKSKKLSQSKTDIAEKNENGNILKNIINIWFISAFLLIFVCEPNINRINIIFIPIIYYTIIGIYEIIKNIPKLSIILLIFYLIAFALFIYNYKNTDFCQYPMFVDKIESTIKYVDNLDADTVYMQYLYKEPYIYNLFYTKENPHTFHSTVQYKIGDKAGFENVKAYGKYRFYLPKDIKPEKGVVYVISIKNASNIDYSKWNATYIDNFIILEYK